jgi:hypothetical protein
MNPIEITSKNKPTANFDPINEIENKSCFELIPKRNIEFQNLHNELVENYLYQKTDFDYFQKIQDITKSDIELELQKNLYFVTFQFNPNISCRNFDANKQLALANAVASFYEKLCNLFIRFPFSGNSKLLPFVQNYFDAEGSRYGWVARDVSVPHFHGLFLLHPKTTERFERVLKDIGQPITIKGNPAIEIKPVDHHPLETVTFEKFNPEIKPLKDLVSYTTKYARNDRFVKGYGEYLELWTALPRVPKRMYPFYRHLSKPIFTEADFASFEKQN